MFPVGFWPVGFFPTGFWPKVGADVVFSASPGRTRTIQIDPRLCEVPAIPRERTVSASDRTRIIIEES